MGSTGPKSVNPATGEPWALDFPVITVADMVRAQKLLIDQLGIDKLFCVTGGSMGGMQVLEWAAQYPDQVFAAVPIATATRHTRSEGHTSELQSLMRNSYAVFCLKKKNNKRHMSKT